MHADKLEQDQAHNVEGQIDLGGRVIPEDVWLQDLLRAQILFQHVDTSYTTVRHPTDPFIVLTPSDTQLPS